jgi:hypothetical protein|tara:strand:- start:1114 stop:1323 length:210 start_codon:yes stop_codon:yes gene_type:complete
MNLIPKNIMRFYSTPTFHRNFKYKSIKKNIINRNFENYNKDNTEKKIKYNTYYSYKNMYTGLPIKTSND